MAPRAAAPAPGPNASLDEHDRAVIVREILRLSPKAFLQTVTPRTLRNARCPITWACRAPANGEPWSAQSGGYRHVRQARRR